MGVPALDWCGLVYEQVVCCCVPGNEHWCSANVGNFLSCLGLFPVVVWSFCVEWQCSDNCWSLGFVSCADRVTGCLFCSYRVTKLQSYKVTELQSYKVTKLQSYKVTKLQRLVTLSWKKKILETLKMRCCCNGAARSACWLDIAFCWVIAQRIVGICYRRFGTTNRVCLGVKNSKDDKDRLPETSVRNLLIVCDGRRRIMERGYMEVWAVCSCVRHSQWPCAVVWDTASGRVQLCETQPVAVCSSVRHS